MVSGFDWGTVSESFVLSRKKLTTPINFFLDRTLLKYHIPSWAFEGQVLEYRIPSWVFEGQVL